MLSVKVLLDLHAFIMYSFAEYKQLISVTSFNQNDKTLKHMSYCFAVHPLFFVFSPKLNLSVQ